MGLNGERYIVDKFGKKIELKVLENGKMYYLDDHGNIIIISDLKEISEPIYWQVNKFLFYLQKIKSNKQLTLAKKNTKTFD